MNNLLAFSCKSCGLNLTVVILLLLLISGNSIAQSNGPQSLGAYFGPLTEFRPNARIMVVYAEGEVMFVAREELEKKKINAAQFIYKSRRKQILNLLEKARQLAGKHKAPAYALANLKVNTHITADMVIVETWGDMLGVRLGQ